MDLLPSVLRDANDKVLWVERVDCLDLDVLEELFVSFETII